MYSSVTHHTEFSVGTYLRQKLLVPIPITNLVGTHIKMFVYI